ncbi:MAG: DUF58 domain-containing protein [Treponema sp.]|nr:DUF58 domain-containing protein [Treponema sp.]
MVKTSSLVPAALVISAAFTLIIPFRLIQFIGYSIFILICLTFIYAKILAKKIKVDRPVSELKLACKEHVIINFTIKNYSIFPAFICYYSDTAPYLYIFHNENSGIITLRPHEARQIKYKISTQDRGLYPVGPVKIHTSDPLGLFQIELELPCELKITVRPARIKLSTLTYPGFPQGALKIHNPIYEDITMRRSVREYVNGDEVKRINWRLSAKFDRLFTNQYEESYDAPFFVFLNLAEEDYDFRNRSYHSEKAIEIAASIVEASRVKKQRCGFAAYGSDFPYLKPAANQADVILDLLSLIKTVPGKLPYNPEAKFRHQLPAGTMLFVIGPREVENYFLKIEADKEELDTHKLKIERKKAVNGL